MVRIQFYSDVAMQSFIEDLSSGVLDEDAFHVGGRIVGITTADYLANEDRIVELVKDYDGKITHYS